jgi:hypothetical protein
MAYQHGGKCLFWQVGQNPPDVTPFHGKIGDSEIAQFEQNSCANAAAIFPISAFLCEKPLLPLR